MTQTEKSVTPGQLRVLREIARYLNAEGFPPTVREICDGLGLVSTNGVQEHLRALEKRGAITKKYACARALVITPLGEGLVSP